MFDYLSRFKNDSYIYIDFKDTKLTNFAFFENINKFLLSNNIKTIVLDNFDISLPIPNIKNIIIIVEERLKKPKFKTIFLQALKFKEFLLFDKHQSITTSFDFFLKYGNLPQTIKTPLLYRKNQLKLHLESLCENKTQFIILKEILKVGGTIVSKNQIYHRTKKQIKISKDKFFNFMKKLESQNIIYFISKYGYDGSLKKMFIHNFVYISSLNITNKFKHQFENMVYLELCAQCTIFYINKIDFYIPSLKTIYLCMPFFSTYDIKQEVFEFIETEDIKKIIIITINKKESFSLNKIKCEVIPFYSWAAL